MVFPLFYGPLILLQKVSTQPPSEGTTAALWIIGLVIGVAVATFTGVIITQNLNRFYKMSEERYTRLEKSDDRQLEKMDKIIDGLNKLNAFADQQKDKNKYYAEEIEGNREKIDNAINKMNDLIFELLKKK